MFENPDPTFVIQPFTMHHKGEMCIGLIDGEPWAFWRHPDGQWVTECKVDDEATSPSVEPGAWQKVSGVEANSGGGNKTAGCVSSAEPGAAREAVAIALREHFWLGRLGHNGAPCPWEEEDASMRLNYLSRADVALTSQPAATKQETTK